VSGMSGDDRARLPAAVRAVGTVYRPCFTAAHRRPDARHLQGDRGGLGGAEPAPATEAVAAQSRAATEVFASRSSRPTKGANIRELAGVEEISMNARRRVFATGIGVSPPIGTGVDAFRAGLRAARSPVRRIDRFDPSEFRSQVAGAGRRLRPAGVAPNRRSLRQLDRFSQFGLVAGRLALDDARLTSPAPRTTRPRTDRDLPRQRARRDRLRGVAARAVHGQGHPPGGAEPCPRRLRRRGPRPISGSRSTCAARSCRRPIRAPRGASALGEALGTCATGGSTRRSPGAAKVPAERPRVRCRSTSSVRSRRRHNDDPESAARPFDADRDWLRHGRGRRVARARDRGDRPCARRRAIRGMLGYGATSDAYHMVQPASRRPRGRPSRADRAGGRRRGRRPRSTTSMPTPRRRPIGDIAEARAIALALGERATSVPVSGTKGVTTATHSGASGAIEGVPSPRSRSATAGRPRR
jgi:3-oxoacyl-[acyl-carrier-protein] synthase II